jgi:hypothetical protein
MRCTRSYEHMRNYKAIAGENNRFFDFKIRFRIVIMIEIYKSKNKSLESIHPVYQRMRMKMHKKGNTRSVVDNIGKTYEN